MRLPALAAAAAGILAIGGPAAAPARAAPAPVPVGISFQPALAGRAVPARFLGLSFEVGSLAQLGGYAQRGDLGRLLRSLGPGVLRFGGITADQNVAWSEEKTPRPPWATSTIGPSQMRALAELARRSGWQVLLTVGMAHFEPEAIAREVASAKHYLGRNLLAVEFGNEPDAYGRHGFKVEPWGVQSYEEEVGIAREAIEVSTHGIAVAGPDVSGSGLFGSWGFAEAVTQQPLLLTGHHYPLGCTHQPPPSSELLLDPALRGREAQSLATYVGVASAHGLPLRIDEAGSVSCGGVSGVSDTFAGALWAAGYIAQAMSAGASGINLHGHPSSCSGYSPLCAPDAAAVETGELRAQPEWYAMLLTRSLIGWRPMPTAIAVGSAPPEGAPAPNLVASGFAGHRGALKLLLSDDDPPASPPLALRVAVGAGMGSGQVQRMTAPAPAARWGVLLGGRTGGADGRFRSGRAQRAPSSGGYVAMTLQPSSAALLTVERARPRRPPRRSKHRRPLPDAPTASR